MAPRYFESFGKAMLLKNEFQNEKGYDDPEAAQKLDRILPSYELKGFEARFDKIIEKELMLVGKHFHSRDNNI